MDIDNNTKSNGHSIKVLVPTVEPSEPLSTDMFEDRDISPLVPEDGTETQPLGHSQIPNFRRPPVFKLSKNLPGTESSSGHIALFGQ